MSMKIKLCEMRITLSQTYSEQFVSGLIHSTNSLPPIFIHSSNGQIYTVWIFPIAYVKLLLVLELEEVGKHWLTSRNCFQFSFSLTVGLGTVDYLCNSLQRFW